MTIQIDELRGFISDMYSDVARFPRAQFHFATGRSLMEGLGYAPEQLDQVPQTALESCAGVGHHFALTRLPQGARVLDVGSGAGSDVFVAALQVGAEGEAVGVDMTGAMLDKARKNAESFALDNVSFVEGYAEALPFEDGRFDWVISNGVINLSPNKPKAFSEIHRVLTPGGRLLFSDLVTGVELPESVRDNCELWAECIGGAEQEQAYIGLIQQAGFDVQRVVHNDYAFIQESTINAAKKFQVRSVSVLAVRT
ncbi:MAG: methyltransferase domain-containing protein [Myxococcales bacterium]|nr:methyltransferase domain-containing protein [Myxococcales bacterium]MDD9966790.1 methyltransferase domain-containing protein [Myxococcales bacterium]